MRQQLRREYDNGTRVRHRYSHEIDTRPGNYYVSCKRDDGRMALLLGPFDNHTTAISFRYFAELAMEEVDLQAFWYAYGTVRMADDYAKPGKLNNVGVNRPCYSTVRATA